MRKERIGMMSAVTHRERMRQLGLKSTAKTKRDADKKNAPETLDDGSG